MKRLSAPQNNKPKPPVERRSLSGGITPRQIMFLEERALYYPPKCSKADASEIITEYLANLIPGDEQHPHDQGDHGDHD